MVRYIVFTCEILLIVALLFLDDYSPETNDFLNRHPRVQVLVYLIFVVAVIDALRRFILFSYAKKHRLSRLQRTNFQYGIDNIARVLITLAGVVFIFQLFGVEVRTLLTSISIVAAAIAIISKDYITDFLVGLYFSFSKDFEINDYVRFGEQKGKITELQMLKIRLLNDDDHSVLIPNTKIYLNEIINYTKRDIRLMSIDFQLNLNAVGHLEQLESDLIASLEDFAEFIEPQSFNLRIVELKKDYIDLKFQYTLKKFDRDLQQQIRKKTVRQVFNSITGRSEMRGEG